MMEALTEQRFLSPEEETLLDFNALLGAFEDSIADGMSAQAVRQVRDDQIFNGLKRSLQSAETMRNIDLLQTMTQRIAEMACNHDHFAEQIDTYDVFGHSRTDETAHGHDRDNHDSKSDKGNGEKDKKKKSKKKKYSGWLGWLASY